MHHIPSLGQNVETRCRALVNDMREIFHFYGREDSAQFLEQLCRKYGRDSVQTCLGRGWLETTSINCAHSLAYKTSSSSALVSKKGLCWITHNGLNASL